MVIKESLNNLNITCDEAENGQISVDLHKEGKNYDLILMDYEMPVMDGHEVSLSFLSFEIPYLYTCKVWPNVQCRYAFMYVI